jgi:CBS domain protein
LRARQAGILSPNEVLRAEEGWPASADPKANCFQPLAMGGVKPGESDEPKPSPAPSDESDRSRLPRAEAGLGAMKRTRLVEAARRPAVAFGPLPDFAWLARWACERVVESGDGKTESLNYSKIRRKVMRAKNVMSDEVISVNAGATVLEAVRLLVNSQVSAMPVIDDHGIMVGILSEADRSGTPAG